MSRGPSLRSILGISTTKAILITPRKTTRSTRSGVTKPITSQPTGEALCITRERHTAAVGVVEHGNSAVLITVGPRGELLDRRRVDLTRGLPTHPYHHEGSWAVGRYLNSSWAHSISLPEAVALVERVRQAAALGAHDSLEALATAVPVPISCIAIRECPRLPQTTEERISDTRAANIADSVMYREALATAAAARGWYVNWYDRKRVWREASAAIAGQDIEAFLRHMGRSIGPPWQANHKLAAAAALAAAAQRKEGQSGSFSDVS